MVLPTTPLVKETWTVVEVTRLNMIAERAVKKMKELQGTFKAYEYQNRREVDKH